jgi:hypothetical protein
MAFGILLYGLGDVKQGKIGFINIKGTLPWLRPTPNPSTASWT